VLLTVDLWSYGRAHGFSVELGMERTLICVTVPPDVSRHGR